MRYKQFVTLRKFVMATGPVVMKSENNLEFQFESVLGIINLNVSSHEWNIIVHPKFSFTAFGRVKLYYSDKDDIPESVRKRINLGFKSLDWCPLEIAYQDYCRDKKLKEFGVEK